jgi:hypothetical protein
VVTAGAATGAVVATVAAKIAVRKALKEAVIVGVKRNADEVVEGISRGARNEVGQIATIKPGSSGGVTAGKPFSQSVRQEELGNNPATCVYCRMETSQPQVDHAIPRARGGNAMIENAQTTCPHCNASKGAREFPVTPPPSYTGPWPPAWWGSKP